MSFTRRTFLIGAGSGLSLLVLTACVPEQPKPTPTASPTPTSTVPRPSAMVRSSWSTDSFSRGSHSFLAVGSGPDQREALAEPVLDRVFFAGEATSVDNAGTVRGARQSGARVAIEVAAAAADGDRIAVIGAGAAGAEAARLLTIRGYEVVVLEARERIGGRIHTIQSGDWPVPPELGAWRIRETADADLLADLARIPVSTVDLQGAVLNRAAQADVADNTVGAQAVATAAAWASEQPNDLSLDAALDRSGATESAAATDVDGVPGAELLESYLAVLSTENGAAATELSGWFALGGVPIEGDQDPADQIRGVTGGYSTLVADALDGVETFLSTAVVRIAYDDSGVSLRLGTGESLSVDRVIVTVPVGVLKDDSLTFDPLLPFSHRSAIADLGVGTVDSVWLRFEEPFWSTDAVAWTTIGTDHPLTVWFNLEPVTGDPVLVGLVGGDAALGLAELDDEALLAAAMASLEPFAGA